MNIPGSFCSRINVAGAIIDRERNTINDQPLIFGDYSQIEVLEKGNMIMAGQYPIYQLEPTPRSYNYIRNIYFHTSWKKADSLVDYVPCIRCGRLHKFVFPYDPHLHYDSILHTSNFEFDCWNCDQSYEVDSEGYVYINPPP